MGVLDVSGGKRGECGEGGKRGKLGKKYWIMIEKKNSIKVKKYSSLSLI
jgi:hypothetical protein